MTAIPSFAVITGAQVQRALRGREREVVELAEAAYRLHCSGAATSAPCSFLRFADRPSARIVAMPASLGGPASVAGMKWIASFPENAATGIPRASAVVILNDHESGYPFACLEGSIVSATRTAAFAAAAAHRLSRGRPRPVRIGFIGTGLIARYVHRFLARTGWSFGALAGYDTSAESAAGFHASLGRLGADFAVQESAERLIRSSDLLVIATTAREPHITEPAWFEHCPLVLHLSLRDLAPEILLGATNILDDTEHCLSAGTSAQLAEQLSGGRDFVHGTLDDVIAGRVSVPRDRPVVFSPFGLAVLDVALGSFVYDEVAASGELHVFEGFFHERLRYATESDSEDQRPAASHASSWSRRS